MKCKFLNNVLFNKRNNLIKKKTPKTIIILRKISKTGVRPLVAVHKKAWTL